MFHVDGPRELSQRLIYIYIYMQLFGRTSAAKYLAYLLLIVILTSSMSICNAVIMALLLSAAAKEILCECSRRTSSECCFLVNAAVQYNARPKFLKCSLEMLMRTLAPIGVMIPS